MAKVGAAALAVLLVSAGLGGCAGAPPSDAPQPRPPARPAMLPPRPADLRVDQVEVCALLSPVERINLKIDDFGTNHDNTSRCTWKVGRRAQSYGWSAGFDQRKGIEQAARGTGARVTAVEGFPAVQTSSSVFDPAYNCIYIVDIASDQDFSVYYQNDRKDIPGMTHEQACRQALSVAELTVANLKAKAR